MKVKFKAGLKGTATFMKTISIKRRSQLSWPFLYCINLLATKSSVYKDKENTQILR